MSLFLELTDRWVASRKSISPSDQRRDDPAILPHSIGKRFVNSKASAYMEGYGGSNAVDWAYDCATLIAETGSAAAFHFERDGKTLVAAQSDITDDETQAVAPEDLTYLMENPNPYMDYVELMALTIIDLYFAGEFIWYLYQPDGADRPVAVYRLNPAMVDVLPGEKEFIRAYEYKVPGKLAVEFAPENILHGKRPNPHDQYRGLSIIAGGPRVYDVELAVVESQAQYFEQGTQLSGVLTTDKRVPVDVFNLVQRQFANMYAGLRNRYKVAVLEAGLKYSPTQSNAQEADFDRLAKLSRNRIMEMFRVPPPLLGNMENANYKMSEAQRTFDTKTMRPLLDKLERLITKGLTSRWGVEFKIDYEYVMPDEDRLNLATTVGSLPGIKIREVREQAGLPPLGDERDDIVLNLPGEDSPMPSAAGQPGRPPNRENVRRFPDAGDPLPTRAQAMKALIGEAPAPDPLKSARVPAVDNMAHYIETEMNTAVHILEVELRSELDAKATGLTRRIKNSKAWGRFTARVERILTTAAKLSVQTAHDQHLIVGLQSTELDLEKIAHELVFRDVGAPAIVDNLKEAVATIVGKGLANGLEVADIAEALSEKLAAYRTPGQVRTIANTEAAEYYNEGALRTAEANGYDHVMVLDGTDNDPECRHAAGQVWTTDKARLNRTQHPNCRRSFIPIAVD